MILVAIGIVLQFTAYVAVVNELLGMLLCMFLLAMLAPWIIWKRRQRPMLTIEEELLRINTAADTGEEHLLPFSKIASLYIARVEQKTLNMFEYEIPWPFNRDNRYGQTKVDAIVIETTDGRQVPRIPVDMFKRRHRKEIRAWVGDIQTRIESVALAKDTQPQSLQARGELPLGIAIGELRDTVLANYGEQEILAIPGGDDSGHSVSVAPVRLWNLDGFLTADFNRHDRLCSLTWQSDPTNHITEAIVRQILDNLEAIFGQTDEQYNELGWKRRDWGVVRELGVEGEDAPYSLWYTEHPV
jgi:hypothetical protein